MTPTVRRELYSSNHGIDMLFLAFGLRLSQDYVLPLPRHDPLTNPKFLRASYPTAGNLPSNTTTHHTLIHPAVETGTDCDGFDVISRECSHCVFFATWQPSRVTPEEFSWQLKYLLIEQPYKARPKATEAGPKRVPKIPSRWAPEGPGFRASSGLTSPASGPTL